MIVRLLACLAGLLVAWPTFAAEPPPSPTTNEIIRARLDLANRTWDRRAYKEAINAATAVLQMDPKNVEALRIRSLAYVQTKESEKAVADFTEIIQLAPHHLAYQYRGEERFRLAHVKEAVADFDKVLNLNPAQAPWHWQRGIALYYAGRYEEGRRQFESHQTVNSNDVENAIWHFLCVARTAGLVKARESLIPIEGDPRIPMSQIHALFAGKATVEDVLKAANVGKPGAEELKNRLFYAHLCLALYYEASGNSKLVGEHLEKATDPYAQEHYMGDVARVHLKLWKAAER